MDGRRTKRKSPHGDNIGRILSTVALLLICACASDTSVVDAVDAAGPSGTVTARFVPGGLSNVIVVSAVDRLPLRQAVLVLSDGERVPAYSIDVDSGPQLALVPNEGFILANPGAQRTSTSAQVMSSTGLIQLPDPVQYAKTWRNARVEVTLGDPGSGKREETLAAPPSPPF